MLKLPISALLIQYYRYIWRYRLVSCLLGLSVVVSGCSLLPSRGPLVGGVVHEPSSSGSADTDAYIVVPLSRALVEKLAKVNEPDFAGTFSNLTNEAGYRAKVGDKLSVSLWEASGGGLFSSADGGAPRVDLPPQAVAADSSITVPFAGRINVIGKSLREIEASIVKALSNKAIKPQAVVTLAASEVVAATVINSAGDGGGRVTVALGRDRLLDVIAQLGGTRAPLHDTVLTLTRNGQSRSAPLDWLAGRPIENILVERDDTLVLTQRPAEFTVLGSAGKNAVVPFDSRNLSLEKAVAKAGGLVGFESDARGVFLLRRIHTENDSILKFVAEGAPPGTRNVIFQANLEDVSSLFLARQFNLQPDDILYVASARGHKLAKFLQLIGLTNATSASIRQY